MPVRTAAAATKKVDPITKARYIAQTKAAREARWPGGTAASLERWAEKKNDILVFIGRLGWSTSAMICAYLRSANRDWVKKLLDERMISLQKVIVAGEKITREMEPGSVATVIVLTEKGHIFARNLDTEIGKRISAPNRQQVRHDLIAAWAAVELVSRDAYHHIPHDELEIWSDQVRRQYLKNTDSRPDVLIRLLSHSVKDVAIEVERRPKKSGWPEVSFAKKIEAFEESHTVFVVVENEEKASELREFVFKIADRGLPRYYSHDQKTWSLVMNSSREKFHLSFSLYVWNHAEKTFSSKSWMKDGETWIDRDGGL